jgi:hypothetical protein
MFVKEINYSVEINLKHDYKSIFYYIIDSIFTNINILRCQNIREYNTFRKLNATEFYQIINTDITAHIIDV